MGDAVHFLQGRTAYVEKMPAHEVAERVETLDNVKGSSFLLGFLDGALADLRDCAQNAREEMAARKVDPRS